MKSPPLYSELKGGNVQNTTIIYKLRFLGILIIEYYLLINSLYKYNKNI